MPRRPFDPFDDRAQPDGRFDPFGLAGEEEDMTTYPAAIGELQARIIELETLTDVETTEQIISILRQSRRRLELMLDMAHEEIDTLRLERDVALENLETHKRIFAAFARAYWRMLETGHGD